MFGIVEQHPIHLGHLVAEAFLRQGQRTKLGAIFVGPYMTRLIRCMGLLKCTRGMTMVGDVAALGPATLRVIGLVERKDGSYIFMRHLATGESSQREPVKTDSKPEDTPTPIPGTTLPLDFDAKLRGWRMRFRPYVMSNTRCEASSTSY